MDKVMCRMTVFFEKPFWVGVFERIDNEKLSVCKVTFGAEPKDYEVYDFISREYYHLKFSPAVATVEKQKFVNPKRMQRNVKCQLEQKGIGTKAQQALKLQQEQCKTERKAKSREKKQAEVEQRFELKQQKRREKHKGH